MTIVNRKALEEKINRTAPFVQSAILKGIRDFLFSAQDVQLANINPLRFAASRNLNPLGTLKAFLYLTKEGLFNLYWTIHCPSCKGPTQLSDKLLALKHDSNCAFCDIRFDAGFDKSIEVSFAVSPAIIQPGPASEFDLFLASVDTEPGIAMELDPGESHYLQADLLPGNYLLVVTGDKKVVNLAVRADKSGQARKLAIDYTDDQGLLTVLKAAEGRAEILVTNRTSGKRDFLFARMVPPRWPSAALVSSLQEFRDLFSSEMLSVNETFSIESLSFLFTDIKGSTELYERLGDSQAFHLVKEHFDIMERIVRGNDGGVVKTIGDAVMAVFVSSSDALRSAVEMIEAFDDFETAQKLKNSIIIKVGIHYGPCIAVTLNEKLDYFGTTVNIAARVQGLSDGRDIMASDALFAESEAPGFLGGRGWTNEPFVTSLKGLKSNYRVHKLSHSSAP